MPTVTESSAAAVHEFVGTPAEYSEALTACLVQMGWQVDTRDDGFSVDMSGRTDDEYIADYEGCVAEVGVEPTSDLSEDELRARYEWRLEQCQCLADNGFAVGDEMSFETFVDIYERTGIPGWDPIEPLATDPLAVRDANDSCPYSTSEW